jgi:UPF0716 family protein affecting phage T7 exclusion
MRHSATSDPRGTIGAGKAGTGLLQSPSMTDIRPLLRTFDRDLLFKVIGFLLLYAIVPLAEIFLFIYLGTLIGNYLVLVAAAVAGLPGAVITFGQLRRLRARLRVKVARDQRPGREIADLAAIIAVAILLVTPGFLTDLLGYLLMVPFVRERLGRSLMKKLGAAFPEINNFFRLLAI